MFKTYCCILSLVIFFNLDFVYADGDIFNQYQMQPEVFHFAKPDYGQINAKGDLNLSIPIITIPGRNGLDFPIVFQYQSGITLFQSASWIGLGWSWDPGSITRDIKGSVVADGEVMGVDFPIGTGADEYAHDIYYLHLNGSTTPFYKDYIGIDPYNLLVPTGNLFPGKWNHWKIEANDSSVITVRSRSTSDYDYEGFTVTTDDGTRFIYERPTLATYINIALNQYGAIIFDDYREIINYVSTWRLRAILAPDYDGSGIPDPTQYPKGGWIRFDYRYSQAEEVYSFLSKPGTNYQSLTQLTYLEKITTPTHKALFECSIRNDKDLKIDSLGIQIARHKLLESIELFDRNDLTNPKESITLFYGTMAPQTATGKSRLDSIKIYGRNSLAPLKYSFEYYLPYTSIDPELKKDAFDYDDFGYFNTDGPFEDTSNDTTSAIYWSLKKIIYPTGGSEQFFYQHDRMTTGSLSYFYYEHEDINNATTQNYVVDLDNNIQGGLRVLKSIREDGMGHSYDYSYKYGTGFLTSVPPYYFIRNNPQYSSINLSASRGHSAIYYDEIIKTLPDGSAISTYYYTPSGGNVFRFSKSDDILISVIQENNDWDAGRVEKIQYYEDWNNDKISKRVLYYYNSSEVTLCDNSWDYRYPVNYVLGFSTLSSEKTTINPAVYDSVMIDTTDKHYPSLQSETHYDYDKWQVVKKTEYAHNGISRKNRVTDYEYAYKRYNSLKQKNILVPTSRIDVSYVDPMDTSAYYYSVSAFITGAFPANYVSTDTVCFTVGQPVTAIYSFSLSGISASSFEILENGTRRRIYSKNGNYSYTIALSPGNTYCLVAYACNTKGGEADDRTESSGNISFNTTFRECYSSKITTWREFNIADGEINTIDFWKPYREYVWTDTSVGSWYSFSTWDSTSTPSDSRWQQAKTYSAYDQHGHLTRQTDAKGNNTYLYYGDNLHPLSNDPAHDDLAHAYLTGVKIGDLTNKFYYENDIGKVTKIEDENNKNSTFEYDNFDRLKTVKKTIGTLLKKVNEYQYYYSLSENAEFDSTDPNYILTKTHFSPDSIGITKEFFDGLGRSIQTQSQIGSIDLVNAVDYDGLGRVIKNWKTYSYNTGHEYDDEYSSHASAYYDGSPGPNTSGYAYSKTEYYIDALDRQKYVVPPGSAFQSHHPKYAYLANYSNEVSGYLYNKLWKTLVEDENGNKSESFTDLFGNEILKRQFLIVGTDTTVIETKFEKDILGNLLKTTNPEGKISKYRYDTQNRMIAKATPDHSGDGDTDPIDENLSSLNDVDYRYKYDRNGNLRFVQDPIRKNNNQVIFYKYDDYNRKLTEGVASATWAALNPDTSYSFENVYMSIIYNYDGTGSASGAQNLEGKLTSVYYKQDGWWHKTYFSYNSRGLVEWQKNQIYGNTKILDYSYDYQGNVTRIAYDQSGSDRMFFHYFYNEQGQLESVSVSKMATAPGRVHAFYEYWPSGKVKTLKLGEQPGGSFAEELDYTYTERDWLQGINAPYYIYDAFLDNNKFGMKLFYNSPGGSGTAQYNGNISVAEYYTKQDAISEKTTTGSHYHRYEFSYDDLNRIKGASFYYNNPIEQELLRWSSSNAFKIESLTYDKVGNITTLTRKNQSGSGSPYTYNYYTNTNWLKDITNLTSSQNYNYDSNGNLSKDYSKGISASGDISYDYRNLPTNIDINDGYFEYLYDYSGNRIVKRYSSDGESETGYIYFRGLDGKTIVVYDLDENLLFYNIYGLELIGKIKE